MAEGFKGLLCFEEGAPESRRVNRGIAMEGFFVVLVARTPSIESTPADGLDWAVTEVTGRRDNKQKGNSPFSEL